MTEFPNNVSIQIVFKLSMVIKDECLEISLVAYSTIFNLLGLPHVFFLVLDNFLPFFYRNSLTV
jgi:hypothetical protein